MDAQPLYDLSPIARMMLMGVVIALGPLAWVWMRNRAASPARRLQALTLLTLFLTFDLVIFGAFTRLTDSGLGCPDWPGCYGNASPLGAHAEISAAQQAMPTGPVTHSKAWIEMVHRYLATGVGVLILTLAITTWIERRRPRGTAPISPWWATATLVWVCLQGAFGALTVTMKLFPAIVTLHLVGGLILLVLLCAQAVQYRHAHGAQAVGITASAKAWLWAAFGAITVQIVLGGWVSTNYAVLACTDFPQCHGSWWPAMDFSQGFEVWRPLGMTSGGENISFAALTAIHYAHRAWAIVALGTLGIAAWSIWRVPGLRAQARWLAALGALQFLTGMSNIVFDWPLIAAVMHTGGAAAMVVALTWALCESRAQPVATRHLRGHEVSA